MCLDAAVVRARSIVTSLLVYLALFICLHEFRALRFCELDNWRQRKTNDVSHLVCINGQQVCWCCFNEQTSIWGGSFGWVAARGGELFAAMLISEFWARDHAREMLRKRREKNTETCAEQGIQDLSSVFVASRFLLPVSFCQAWGGWLVG